MAKKLPPQRFNKGDFVYVHQMGRECQIKDIRWNGFTWLYSFFNEAMSCGEDYLSRIERAKEVR